MAKYLKLLMMALFAAMIPALSSCGDDEGGKDEPTPPADTAFTVNGEKLRLCTDFDWDGGWFAAEGNKGWFIIVTQDPNGEIERSFSFEFVSPEPKIGSNLAGKSLKMTSVYFEGGSQPECSFKSGKLTVREFGDWTMTVRFENLRMEGTDENGKKVSYTFNGVATVPFVKFFD